MRAKARAHWLRRGVIAWPVQHGGEGRYELHYAPEGGLEVGGEGIRGGRSAGLEFMGGQLSPELGERFPHLREAVMLRVPGEAQEHAAEMLKGQVAVAVMETGDPGRGTGDGRVLEVTGAQIAGVLDDLYANDEALGVTFSEGAPRLRVWAPTARAVRVQLYSDSKVEAPYRTVPMDWDAETGVWEARGEAEWRGQYYLYEVEVYVPRVGRVVRNLVTDPYSVSLASNSRRSQIVDLKDAQLKPEGWDGLRKPELAAATDIVAYELHVRDFSAWDESVPEALRGTYLAFTQGDSYGMRHLKQLAEAGVTHVHLLPAFDFATTNEDRRMWAHPDYEKLATYPPDSERQQAAVMATRHRDGYNWGYDPWHYTTPEGSYATDPDGLARIAEFRRMVMALNRAGLRVVMDVVYTHTHAAGQEETSVLDRIVPGYYHRLDGEGEVLRTTCCPNTASEHAMMEKLMRDSILTWARDYKVDGFRFDLMGHHMATNMRAVRAALDGLSIENSGVDGKRIYLYGEGWSFGEVANNLRGANATQQNLAGSGIGTFNDRMRDAVRGGNPFNDPREQGYATGLFTDPNEAAAHEAGERQRARLLALSDVIRVGLAGNLAAFRLVNAQGQEVTGREILYNGAAAGYTLRPEEHVAYSSAHDNETLFDAIQYKAPAGLDMAERVRMQALALSIVILSQGVAFLHAGCEVLRSKSLDRNSYDSGDWFNRLDLSYGSNNWGVGLPPAEENRGRWPIMRGLLGRAELKPGREDMLACLAQVEDMLRIRKSTPALRLRTAAEVMARVRFHNTGPGQVPGLIVMSVAALTGVAALTSVAERTGDGGRGMGEETGASLRSEEVVVMFNAGRVGLRFGWWGEGGAAFELHPVQAASRDPVVRGAGYDGGTGSFWAPGRTVAVFVRRRDSSYQL